MNETNTPIAMATITTARTSVETVGNLAIRFTAFLLHGFARPARLRGRAD